jgi:hypothetical protein
MTIVDFNADEATWIGDEQDGCYFQVGKGPDGWYVTVVVDCETNKSVDNLYTDQGPFANEWLAIQEGLGLSIDWCVTNGVPWDQKIQQMFDTAVESPCLKNESDCQCPECES